MQRKTNELEPRLLKENIEAQKHYNIQSSIVNDSMTTFSFVLDPDHHYWEERWVIFVTINQSEAD